jgi:hypothetical protein
MVTLKHIATFLPGASAGYDLFKYNSMADEVKILTAILNWYK